MQMPSAAELIEISIKGISLEHLSPRGLPTHRNTIRILRCVSVCVCVYVWRRLISVLISSVFKLNVTRTGWLAEEIEELNSGLKKTVNLGATGDSYLSITPSTFHLKCHWRSEIWYKQSLKPFKKNLFPYPLLFWLIGKWQKSGGDDVPKLSAEKGVDILGVWDEMGAHRKGAGNDISPCTKASLRHKARHR